MVAPGPIVKARVGKAAGPQVPEKVPSLRIRQPPPVTERGFGFSIVTVASAAAATAAHATRSAPASLRTMKHPSLCVVEELQRERAMGCGSARPQRRRDERNLGNFLARGARALRVAGVHFETVRALRGEGH